MDQPDRNTGADPAPPFPAADDARLAELRTIFEYALGVPFTDGNAIEPLRNGVEIFPAMLDAIAAARHSIEFQTFVYWTGEPAQKFAHALSERARAGVAVRVLLDAIGAGPMDSGLIDEMADAGVELRWFRMPLRWKIWQADNRSHRKVLVIDRKTGFTGGVGVAREWEGDARNPEEWRDTHFRLHGPAVRGLLAGFLSNWLEAAPEAPVPPLDRDGTSGGAVADGVPVQVVCSASSVCWSDVATMFKLMAGIAQHRLRVATSYFVPGEMMSNAMIEAVGRGVAVEIMLPDLEMTDSRVSWMAGESEIGALLDGGVRLWRYRRTMLHTKIITVDGCLSCIGSANLNQRSLHKDDELSLIVLDRALAGALDRDFDADLDHALPIDRASWKDRSVARRALSAAAQPFRQQT